jgi:prevent-host-death family protein
MKYVRASEARNNFAQVVEMAQQDYVMLTRQGQPVAVIMGVEGLDPEQIALGLDDDLWEEIERARNSGYISSRQMERELGIKR